MVFLAIVAALAPATRLRVRSHALNDWDAVQYAAALTDYDVSRERPHDPGNPLFVAVAKVAFAAGSDPVEAYVLPNAVIYTAGSLLLFGWLLAELGIGRARWVLVLALATNPMVWYYGSVVSAHPCEMFMSAAVALACWRGRARGLNAGTAALLGALLGIAAGFRPQLGLLLAPLVLYTLWCVRAPFGRWAVAALAALATCLTWGIPMMAESGGLRSYVAVSGVNLRHYLVERSILAGHVGWAIRNAVDVGIGLVIGLCGLLAAMPLRVSWRRKGTTGSAAVPHETESVVFCLVWLLPFALFFVLVFITRAGFWLPALPPVYCLVGLWIERTSRRPIPDRQSPPESAEPRGFSSERGIRPAIATVLAAALNVLYFVCLPAPHQPLAPLSDLAAVPTRQERVSMAAQKLAARFQAFTRDAIRVDQTIIGNYCRTVRRFNPSDTLVVVEFDMAFTWRQAAWYLSEYPVWGLVPGGFRRHRPGVYEAPLERMREARTPEGVREVVWTGLHAPEALADARLEETIDLPYGRPVRRYSLDPGGLRCGFHSVLSAAYGKEDGTADERR